MVNVARIIAPTDFSPAADRAQRRAASLAFTLRCSLDLAHVLPPLEVLEQIFPPPLEKEVSALRARAERALNERAHRIAAQLGVTPACHLLHGPAHEAILAAAESLGSSVVVLGAQGEREGVLPTSTVGNTALKVAEQANLPTLLVRREAQQPYCHVMGCVRGESADRAVIRWTSSVSPEDLIHFVSAYTVPYESRLIEWGASQSTIDVYATRERDQRTSQLSQQLSETDLPAARARLHVERGEPLQTILRTARQWQADLIVVGRRAGVDSQAPSPFGSLARGIAQLAPMDVMIVPPTAEANTQ
jgi:nucleotide-binding universal stress UspA family protein